MLGIIPLEAKRAVPGTDIFAGLCESLKGAGHVIKDGDVLVVSTKYVSCSQGRILRLDNIRPSGAGRDMSKKYRLDPGMAEIISRESDFVFGGIGGFVITMSAGIMAPNAGIDGSNAGQGLAVLYPEDSYLAAEQLRRKIFLHMGVHAGVILADSRLMPARVGTSGVAVACAGMEPVADSRARPDLDGRPLKVTFQATADNLASIANYEMGEAAESRPFVIVRDSGVALTDRRLVPSETAVHPEQCVYVRGLGRKPS
ncbi:MAG: cytidine deaminase [Nitrosopumilus sp. D6]|nr:MAG: cytidine deaminase [Nitrosopumilus sp. D6]